MIGQTQRQLDQGHRRVAITRCRAYWRRAFRAGHAYAEISTRFKDSNDPMWLKDARRNKIHGVLIISLLSLLALVPAWPWLAALSATALVALVGRTYVRCSWKSANRITRLLYSIHAHFQQIPILSGQMGFLLSSRKVERQRLVEYKNA